MRKQITGNEEIKLYSWMAQEGLLLHSMKKVYILQKLQRRRNSLESMQRIPETHITLSRQALAIPLERERITMRLRWRMRMLLRVLELILHPEMIILL